MGVEFDLTEAPLDSQENEEDLRLANSGRRFDAAIASSDWTTETLISQLKKGNIQLDPAFQRRDAWSIPRKSQYIESLIIGIPTPPIILAEFQERRGYIVIDGKQRLLSLRQFSASGDDRFDGFALRGLQARPDLNGRTFDQITDDMSDMIDGTGSDLENATIRTVIIKGWKSEDFLYEVFLRINSGSVRLSPQELRQALHPGEFTNALNEYVIESEALKQALGLKQPDFRMRDNELMIRYIAYQYFLENYNGNLKDILDRTTNFFNDHWDDAKVDILEAFRRFELAVDTTFEIFGRNAFKKWSEIKYESRLNRAVFDVMAFYFSDRAISKASRAKAEQVETAFKALCDDSEDFKDALTSTTKSIDAVSNRLTLWGEKLSETIEKDLGIPTVGRG